ncbi:hypothetical protein TMatcc_002036 [Talaromyces marneffei ATCC 18224]|uniref:Uncharacterized protein n=2 Tax=Talaromyces marneffei TaxID=37727 RepID=B6QII1_TALMQ|nr:uncharacterized protein EYB26_006785 [Talaromyces marneffei]EEA23176.1 conserved hypothetical protein [Talaromyces marneffei ATCC 18224]QGA19097.1 hypothetical protein EYB26_006785 [Talaromyces marneffei]
MIQKRSHAERDEDDRVSSSKRSRASMSPAPDSLGGLEEKSGLRPSSERRDAVNINDEEEEEEEDDDDYTSSSGISSSDEDDDEEEEDDDEDENNPHSERDNKETIPYIPGRPKPQISLPPNSDLLARVSSFLPQLQAANADIEQRLAKGESLEDMILDDVKDNEAEEDGEEGGGKEYIEMNLGLGVLKEKRRRREEGGIDLDDESPSDTDEEEDEAEEDGEGRVMDQLMGLKGRSVQKQKLKAGIQEVEEG